METINLNKVASISEIKKHSGMYYFIFVAKYMYDPDISTEPSDDLVLVTKARNEYVELLRKHNVKKVYFISSGGCRDGIWMEKCSLSIEQIPQLFKLFYSDYNDDVKEYVDIIIDMEQMECSCTFINNWNETEHSPTFEIVEFESIN